jgi:hypothetical protein
VRSLASHGRLPGPASVGLPPDDLRKS